MAVVTSEESRAASATSMFPRTNPTWRTVRYLSPDGKWVLAGGDGYRSLVGAVPSGSGRSAVPLDRRSVPREEAVPCAAWSPDGKWMYFTSNAVGANHIWRQRFPDGEPEQITAGPTAEEGIAMAPDGRSLVTAVSTLGASLWLQDSSGERQISVEGNAANPVFTPDGSKLLYRVVKEQPSEYAYYRDPGEVMVADLRSGRVEPVVPGFRVLNFDISRDGRQVVMEAPDDARSQPALAGAVGSQCVGAPGPECGGWATAFPAGRRNSLPAQRRSLDRRRQPWFHLSRASRRKRIAKGR